MGKVALNSGITRGTSATLFLAIVYRCELFDCLGSVGPNCGLRLEGPLDLFFRLSGFYLNCDRERALSALKSRLTNYLRRNF